MLCSFAFPGEELGGVCTLCSHGGAHVVVRKREGGARTTAWGRGSMCAVVRAREGGVHEVLRVHNDGTRGRERAGEPREGVCAP